MSLNNYSSITSSKVGAEGDEGSFSSSVLLNDDDAPNPPANANANATIASIAMRPLLPKTIPPRIPRSSSKNPSNKSIITSSSIHSHSSIMNINSPDRRIYHEPSTRRKNSSPWIQKPLHLTYSENMDSSAAAAAASLVAASSSTSNHNTESNRSSNVSTKQPTEINSSFHTVSSFYHTVHNPDAAAGSSDSVLNNDIQHPSIITDPSSKQHSNTNISHNNDNNQNHHKNTIKNDNSNKDNKSTHNKNINNSTTIQRHLSLFDLVAIGMGSTIGSGIFVLCGFIAHNYAGPSACISWTLSGLAACLSGLCYAELACRMPSAGSSYVYVYSSMGELPAVVAAFCLTLEYVVTASAVARSWGDKVAEWLMEDMGVVYDLNQGYDDGNYGNRLWHRVLRYILLLNYNHDDGGDGTTSSSSSSIWTPLLQNFNLMACVISTICILLLMNGVQESKRVANFFTITKVLLVVFMTVLSLVAMRPKENLTPFIPPEYGWSGVFRGATSSFFGYIGFDGICCMSGEAINPQRNMPLAIMLTLGGVTVIYILAALGLTGMLPYLQISEVSGFPDAFYQRGYDWAAQICAFGEVFTLPIVVLITILLQPRLQYAMAKDGLLPEIFARVDDSGNLWHGTVISGVVMILIATFVPFEHLNDMVSSGILIAFCMTDSALVLLRHESPKNRPQLVEKFLFVMNLSAFAFSTCYTHLWEYTAGRIVATLSMIAMIVVISGIYFSCDPAQDFGGSVRASPSLHSIKHGRTQLLGGGGITGENSSSYFSTPGMPFVPLGGIFVNWYLITQMELESIGLLLGFLLLAVVYYFCYGSHHSVGRNTNRWDEFIPLEVVKSNDDLESFERDDQSMLTM